MAIVASERQRCRLPLKDRFPTAWDAGRARSHVPRNVA
jgi:hypothetical protein